MLPAPALTRYRPGLRWPARGGKEAGQRGEAVLNELTTPDQGTHGPEDEPPTQRRTQGPRLFRYLQAPQVVSGTASPLPRSPAETLARAIRALPRDPEP